MLVKYSLKCFNNGGTSTWTPLGPIDNSIAHRHCRIDAVQWLALNQMDAKTYVV